APLLGLQDLDLLFGRDLVGLRGQQRRLLLAQVGGGLLRLLLGAGAAATQLLGALILLVRIGERLRLVDLLLGRIDAGVLRGDLGVEIGDRRLRLSDLGVG